MSERVTIVEREHDDLDDDDDYHEWTDVWLREHEAEFGPHEVRRDTLGRRNGGMTLWRRWCCNNLACGGVLLVNTDAVQRFVREQALDAR